MGGDREYTEILEKIAKEMIPNGEIKCGYAELLRFKTIVDAFLNSRGDYQMRKAPNIKRELIDLQDKIDGIFKLNHLQQQLEHLKDDTSHMEEQIISIDNGISFSKFSNLTYYTREKVRGWIRFLNDYQIDLAVCDPDATSYLMKTYLYTEGNLQKTKKMRDVLKDAIFRSESNIRKGR